MSHVRVHYDPTTGNIIAWDNATAGDALRGGKIVVFDVPDGHEIKIDPTAQRIDLQTLELEDLPQHEIDAARGPQQWELKQAVSQELIATDSYLNATDRYVPDRAAWTTYRQALRDASKPQDENNPTQRPTPVEMLNAIPTRPDGRDAAASLRARIPQG